MRSMIPLLLMWIIFCCGCCHDNDDDQYVDDISTIFSLTSDGDSGSEFMENEKLRVYSYLSTLFPMTLKDYLYQDIRSFVGGELFNQLGLKNNVQKIETVLRFIVGIVKIKQYENGSCEVLLRGIDEMMYLLWESYRNTDIDLLTSEFDRCSVSSL